LTIALTTNVPVPNINRLLITRISIDNVNAVAQLHVRALGVGGKIYGEYDLTVVDAPAMSTGLGVNAGSLTYADGLVAVAQMSIANGFTNAESAYRAAAGGRGGAFRALEQQGLTDGWLAAAFVGPVT
jgi:hypothetical protein